MNIFGYVNSLYGSNRVYQLKRSWAADRHLYWSFAGYCSSRDIEREGFIRLPDDFELRWHIPFGHVKYYHSYDAKCYDEPFIRDMTEDECEYYLPANLPYRHGDLGESQ